MSETKTSTPVALFILFALFAALTVFSGLWEVGWQFVRLPGWFYGYALLAGLIGMAASQLPGRDRPERPYLHRTALYGLGWGMPVMAALFGRYLLDGIAAEPVRVVILLVVWTLVSLVYGAFALKTQVRKGG